MQDVARAALAISGRSREIELQRALPPDVADGLADAGLYRLLLPQVLGGHEAPPASFYLAIEQLACTDAAAAWCCFISCTSSVLAAYLPEASAQTLFAGKPRLKMAGVFAPRGRAVPAEHRGRAGYKVSGRWTWGSGTRNADLVSAGCLVMGADGQHQLMADGTPRVLSVLLERHQVNLLDNWDAFGLCGTGSGEFDVRDAFVPQEHCAQASTKPLGSRATVQDAVARADASLQAARCYLLASVEAAWQAAQRSEPVPLEARRHLRQAATHAVQTSAEVVTRVYTLGGGGAVFAASPLQRALRNVQVATQHMMVNDATWELTGRLLLGVPTQTQML